MSCRHVELDALEALVAGELATDAAERLRAHAAGCAACANELAWLTAERELLAQRARRAESPAAHLWAGVQSASAPPPPAPFVVPIAAAAERRRAEARRSVRWGRFALAVAAACVFLVPLLHRSPTPEESGSMASMSVAGGDDSVGVSFDPAWMTEQRYSACLVATPNSALPCSPSVPASFMPGSSF